jgi:hypothetical protein
MNHRFTAAELTRIIPLTSAIAVLEARLNQKIDVPSAYAHAVANHMTILELDDGYSIERMLKSFEGDWCFCLGPVVASLPKLFKRCIGREMRDGGWDIHGQSGWYISKQVIGPLHLVMWS